MVFSAATTQLVFRCDDVGFNNRFSIQNRRPINSETGPIHFSCERRVSLFHKRHMETDVSEFAISAVLCQLVEATSASCGLLVHS